MLFQNVFAIYAHVLAFCAVAPCTDSPWGEARSELEELAHFGIQVYLALLI